MHWKNERINKKWKIFFEKQRCSKKDLIYKAINEILNTKDEKVARRIGRHFSDSLNSDKSTMKDILDDINQLDDNELTTDEINRIKRITDMKILEKQVFQQLKDLLN